MQVRSPTLDLDGTTLCARGRWVLGELEPHLGFDVPQGAAAIDAGDLDALDTAGAFVLHRVARALGVEPSGLRDEYAALYDQVAALAGREIPPPPPAPGFLHRVGVKTLEFRDEAKLFFAFIGELALTGARVLRHPGRMRWKPMFGVFEVAGWGALPILALLSFLIGVVIAYQAGVQLRNYGANIFIVDIIGISVLREFGPLIAAIIVAGRTGSAFTAEIGTMKVNDELDALRTTGISPMEMLALPKVLALVIVLPLLTVFANVMGVAGGIVMAQQMLDVSTADFLDRFTTAVSVSDYLTGIGKAPVFALLIASVGCHQGFQVEMSADSVGRHVTRSVVHSLFLIIVTDAVFSVIFERLGL